MNIITRSNTQRVKGVTLFLILSLVAFVFSKRDEFRLSSALSVRKETIANEEQSVTNFHRNPENFITTLASCLKDNNCNVYYQHVKKTGGTSFETGMLRAFPFHKRDDYTSCCDDALMDRFRNKTFFFCEEKFTSYQVSSSQFQEILEDCMAARPRKSKAVALVSFREPADRTLSYIHQICNKNFNWREPSVQEACKRCDYESDVEIFDNFTMITNEEYQGILNLTKLTLPNVEVMTFEIDDIDDIFEFLKEELPTKKFPAKNLKANTKGAKGSVKRCDFGMKSNMFKGLAPSHAVYKTLTTGI